MEAKDTVMSDVALLQSMLGLPDVSNISEYAAGQDMNTPPGLYFKNGAKAQAEISFKAGFVEGQADKGHNEAILRVANESRKAGIKEAMDWFDSKESVCQSQAHKENYFTIFRDDWEAKLKEWGIK